MERSHPPSTRLPTHFYSLTHSLTHSLTLTHITSHRIMVLFYDYPTPEQALRLGPARNVAPLPHSHTHSHTHSQEEQQWRRRVQALEAAVLSEVTRQTRSGR